MSKANPGKKRVQLYLLHTSAATFFRCVASSILVRAGVADFVLKM